MRRKISTFAPQFIFFTINKSTPSMDVRNYETVFILTPVLNEGQVQETVEKFSQVLKENSADLISTEAWGLRKLAYPIQKKSTGYYFTLTYNGSGNIVDVLELAFRRDERVIRFLTTVLDKHAVTYNERRRNGEMNQQRAPKETEAVAQ
jgi:small subunit ribosomal protein S6